MMRHHTFNDTPAKFVALRLAEFTRLQEFGGGLAAWDMPARRGPAQRHTFPAHPRAGMVGQVRFSDAPKRVRIPIRQTRNLFIKEIERTAWVQTLWLITSSQTRS